MQLGTFSVSLAVKDLKKSKAFYQKLGFKEFAGEEKDHYLIMKNGNATIGLFQGMFDKNILTFNPGWDENAQPLKGFTDIRDLQKQLKNDDITLISETEQEEGPASITLLDPDGNPILIDQHL
jgi:lactoylglutathione lyase